MLPDRKVGGAWRDGDDPDDIADYDQRHTFYTQYTVVGDPARALLTRLADDYRNLAPRA